jgi:hypothetical protein
VNQGTGRPSFARVRHAGLPGKRIIDFDVKTDQAYKLKIGYYEIPDDPADGDIPIYPNDLTLIQAVKVFILRYVKSMDLDGELNILINRVNEDRLKYGIETGINDSPLLDPKTFR